MKNLINTLWTAFNYTYQVVWAIAVIIAMQLGYKPKDE